jgi:hypothetical protein
MIVAPLAPRGLDAALPPPARRARTCARGRHSSGRSERQSALSTSTGSSAEARWAEM